MGSDDPRMTESRKNTDVHDYDDSRGLPKVGAPRGTKASDPRTSRRTAVGTAGMRKGPLGPDFASLRRAGRASRTGHRPDDPSSSLPLFPRRMRRGGALGLDAQCELPGGPEAGPLPEPHRLRVPDGPSLPHGGIRFRPAS